MIGVVAADLPGDATTLVFDSTRPGGFGSDDLYETTRAEIFPTAKDDCKNDGWERFGVFDNQGDCVSYVATHHPWEQPAGLTAR